MALTLAQIAERTGLSVSTVSRVLRGEDRVSPQAVEAVRGTLRVLGLGGGRRSEVGVIVVIVPDLPYFDLDSWRPLRRELDVHLFASGLVAVTVTASADPGLERFADFDLRGVIVLESPVPAALADSAVPVLRIVTHPPAGAGSILLDMAAGIDTAVRHLSQLGHRRLGLAVAQAGEEADRTTAFRRSVARRLHIEATRAQAPVASAGPGVPAGKQAVLTLLDAGCTAIVACGPALTLGALEASRLEQLNLPGQLSILAIGEVPDPEVLFPPISQVTFDWTAVATQAVDAITRAGRGGAVPELQIVPDLLLRRSAAPIQRR